MPHVADMWFIGDIDTYIDVHEEISRRSTSNWSCCVEHVENVEAIGIGIVHHDTLGFVILEQDGRSDEQVLELARDVASAMSVHPEHPTIILMNDRIRKLVEDIFLNEHVPVLHHLPSFPSSAQAAE